MSTVARYGITLQLAFIFTGCRANAPAPERQEPCIDGEAEMHADRSLSL